MTCTEPSKRHGTRSVPSESTTGDPETQDASPLGLAPHTELRDIRLQRFSGEVRRTPPEIVEITLTTGDAQYSRSDATILALFSHRLDYAAAPNGGGELKPFGHVEMVHVVEVALTDGADPTDEAVLDFINTTPAFLVHPYARAALQRLPLEFGLPPVLLPYLRRNIAELALGQGALQPASSASDPALPTD